MDGFDAFRLGAQMMREMQARFIEQGGDASTAQSVRANWNPCWGNDPGQPHDEEYSAWRTESDPLMFD